MDLPESERLRTFDFEKAKAFNEIHNYKQSVSAGQTLVAGLRPGQLEICDGRPKLSSREDLIKHITLKTTGLSENYERAVNFSELKATASVFATALKNDASTDELQTIANDLSKKGCLATNPHAATAVKTFVHYLRTLRLCTARFLPNVERLPRGHYDFDVQLCCLELALQLKADKFSTSVVREIIRESFFHRLNISQWRAVADKVEGTLDAFLVTWASGLDDTYTNYRESKIACLKPALRAVPAIRSVYEKAFREDRSYLRSNRSLARAVANAIREARAIKARKEEKAAKKAAEQAAKKAVDEEEGIRQDTGQNTSAGKAVKREAVGEAEKEETRKVKKSP